LIHLRGAHIEPCPGDPPRDCPAPPADIVLSAPNETPALVDPAPNGVFAAAAGGRFAAAACAAKGELAARLDAPPKELPNPPGVPNPPPVPPPKGLAGAADDDALPLLPNPNAGLFAAPPPPNGEDRADVAPNAGVPDDDWGAPNAGLAAAPKGEDEAAPNAGVDDGAAAPNAGVDDGAAAPNAGLAAAPKGDAAAAPNAGCDPAAAEAPNGDAAAPNGDAEAPKAGLDAAAPNGFAAGPVVEVAGDPNAGVDDAAPPNAGAEDPPNGDALAPAVAPNAGLAPAEPNGFAAAPNAGLAAAAAEPPNGFAAALVAGADDPKAGVDEAAPNAGLVAVPKGDAVVDPAGVVEPAAAGLLAVAVPNAGLVAAVPNGLAATAAPVDDDPGRDDAMDPKDSDDPVPDDGVAASADDPDAGLEKAANGFAGAASPGFFLSSPPGLEKAANGLAGAALTAEGFLSSVVAVLGASSFLAGSAGLPPPPRIDAAEGGAPKDSGGGAPKDSGGAPPAATLAALVLSSPSLAALVLSSPSLALLPPPRIDDADGGAPKESGGAPPAATLAALVLSSPSLALLPPPPRIDDADGGAPKESGGAPPAATLADLADASTFWLWTGVLLLADSWWSPGRPMDGPSESDPEAATPTRIVGLAAKSGSWREIAVGRCSGPPGLAGPAAAVLGFAATAVPTPPPTEVVEALPTPP
jgi:hypothetical protein